MTASSIECSYIYPFLSALEENRGKLRLATSQKEQQFPSIRDEDRLSMSVGPDEVVLDRGSDQGRTIEDVQTREYLQSIRGGRTAKLVKQLLAR